MSRSVNFSEMRVVKLLESSILRIKSRSAVAAIALLVLTASGLPAQQLLPLRITTGTITIMRMIQWVAYEEGIYKKNGLDVDQCIPQGTVNDMKRILNVTSPAQYTCKPGGARSPFSLSGGTPAFLSQAVDPATLAKNRIRAEGDPVKSVNLASVQERTDYVLFARKDITLPEQLKGKRIDFTGRLNILEFQALLFAKAMGWEPGKDVTLVEDRAGTIEGITSGRVDAFIAGEGPEWQALQAGYKPLIDFRAWKVPMASSSVNADRAWLKDNRETARRFIKSLVDTIAVMKKDKQAAYRAMAKYYNITDPKMQEFFYNAWDFPPKPYPAVEGLRNVKVMYRGIYPELDKYKVEDFVDDSFIRELDQSGYIDRLYK